MTNTPARLSGLSGPEMDMTNEVKNAVDAYVDAHAEMLDSLFPGIGVGAVFRDLRDRLITEIAEMNRRTLAATAGAATEWDFYQEGSPWLSP